MTGWGLGGLCALAVQCPAGALLWSSCLLPNPTLALLVKCTIQPTAGRPAAPDPVSHPQLVEFLLALPFALGYKTSIVARLLAITLVCEALTCWQFWGAWPTDTYAAHVR